jgi:hypothetical protein
MREMTGVRRTSGVGDSLGDCKCCGNCEAACELGCLITRRASVTNFWVRGVRVLRSASNIDGDTGGVVVVRLDDAIFIGVEGAPLVS